MTDPTLWRGAGRGQTGSWASGWVTWDILVTGGWGGSILFLTVQLNRSVISILHDEQS